MESALKLFEELTYLETAIEATDLAWNNKFKESSQIIGGLRKSIPRLAIQSSEVNTIQIIEQHINDHFFLSFSFSRTKSIFIF